MKRTIALILALALCLGLALPVSAAEPAEPREYTRTVKARVQYSSESGKQITATVTYTGYLGTITLPSGPDNSIGTAYPMVLADGSEIRISLHVPDNVDQTNAKYLHNNWIFWGENSISSLKTAPYGLQLGRLKNKKVNAQGYGGGYVYKRDAGSFGLRMGNEHSLRDFKYYPVNVFGEQDRTTTWESFNYDDAFAALSTEDAVAMYDGYYYNPMGARGPMWSYRVDTDEYVIKVQNGLFEYNFAVNAAVLKNQGKSYIQSDYNGFNLGLALSVNAEQLKELAETGTMTFHKGTGLEYQYYYPGIEDVFAVETTPDEPEPEYTGGCPTFYRAYVFDHGHGFGCKMTNPTNKTLSGRWGIIACGKDKNGRYFPVDANILTYTLPAGETSDMAVYTTLYAYEDAGYQWQNTTIKKDLWLLRVDLNSDADYQEMLAFADEYLSYNIAEDMNFGDNGWSARYLGENNARLSDTSASSDWLYANFGGALK